ncbi:MAG: hypothetical protein J6W13_02995 [Salinivirgaceae bacterium]|nr:hypothetical protein [Salinivirgaceae bacterium]
MKRILWILCVLCEIFILTGCIKSLEDEGIYGETICTGTVINNQNSQPVEGMRVSKTDGKTITDVTLTEADGSFSIAVTPEDVHRNFYLLIEADSLYGSRDVQFTRFPFGNQQFNLGVVQVQGPVPPTVLTTSVQAIAANSAAAGGNVTEVGGSAVTVRGVCWSTLQLPTVSDPHTTDGRGPGEFTSQLTGLSVNTVYYVRAYATNNYGTGYGEQYEFRTADGLPTVVTDTVTNISATAATANGEAMADGGFGIIARGVCWSTAQQPTIMNNHTIDSLGLGAFACLLTDLEPGTTYYVRAYATNVSGTGYGEQQMFTTLSGLPNVLTAAVDTAAITATTATLGGTVSTDGGFACTARGICYGTQPAPTIANAHTADGSGTGDFTSHIAGLQSGITYYARAYATNVIGTVYGEEVVFETK